MEWVLYTINKMGILNDGIHCSIDAPEFSVYTEIQRVPHSSIIDDEEATLVSVLRCLASQIRGIARESACSMRNMATMKRYADQIKNYIFNGLTNASKRLDDLESKDVTRSGAILVGSDGKESGTQGGLLGIIQGLEVRLSGMETRLLGAEQESKSLREKITAMEAESVKDKKQISDLEGGMSTLWRSMQSMSVPVEEKKCQMVSISLPPAVPIPSDPLPERKNHPEQVLHTSPVLPLLPSGTKGTSYTTTSATVSSTVEGNYNLHPYTVFTSPPVLVPITDPTTGVVSMCPLHVQGNRYTRKEGGERFEVHSAKTTEVMFAYFLFGEGNFTLSGKTHPLDNISKDEIKMGYANDNPRAMALARAVYSTVLNRIAITGAKKYNANKYLPGKKKMVATRITIVTKLVEFCSLFYIPYLLDHRGITFGTPPIFLDGCERVIFQEDAYHREMKRRGMEI